jgi:AcrR family transcriptional regulator
MVRRTKEEALETRSRIMDAAVDVFFERGVANATLNDIANRAEVTRGAIYWHFKNKLDVFHALHDQLQLSFADTILADLRNDHPHPLLQLERLCSDLLIDLETNQYKFKVLSILFFKCDYTGEMEQFLHLQNARKKQNTQLFSEYFSRAKKHKHLSADVDPTTLSMALMSYITGIVVDYLRDTNGIVMSEHAPKFMRFFFRNLA